MSQVLYRKYRPKTFSEITGQDITRTILQNQVVAGNLAHAYLFSGPRGVGKTSVARILAKAINCLERQVNDFEPCNNCDACLTINEGKCFDVLEIDAASHTGVDNVRENIIEGSRFPPSQTKYKVFIIDEVHMLSRGAFNALLKILEEAPAHVIFILATTELHKVPETVASRCQHFAFKKISLEKLVAQLNELAKKEGIELRPEALWAIAHHATGSLRDALNSLGQLISVAGQDGKITSLEIDLVLPKSNRNAVVKFYELLHLKNTNGLLKLIDDLEGEGIDAEKFYDDCIAFGRELVLENPAGNKELLTFLENLLNKKSLMRFSPLPQLPLELAVIDFCNSRSDIARQNFTEATPTRHNSSPRPDTKMNDPSLPIINLMEGEVGVKTSTLVSITIDQVKERWDEFLEKINAENHSLPLILRLAEPLEINNNRLKLAVQYRFHRERLNENKTKSTVEKFLGEIFNQPLRIEPLVRDPIQENQPSVVQENQPSILHTVLQEFGGRVVE